MKTVALQKISREVWVLVGAAVVVAGCLWPVSRMRDVEQRHRAVDQQLMQVQSIAAQAQRLRAQQSAPAGRPAELLQTAVASTLGSAATVNVTGDAATLMLQQAEPAKLAQGLEAIRQNTAARFTAARLDMQFGRVTGQVEMQWPAGQP